MDRWKLPIHLFKPKNNEHGILGWIGYLIHSIDSENIGYIPKYSIPMNTTVHMCEFDTIIVGVDSCWLYRAAEEGFGQKPSE